MSGFAKPAAPNVALLDELSTVALVCVLARSERGVIWMPPPAKVSAAGVPPVAPGSVRPPSGVAPPGVTALVPGFLWPGLTAGALRAAGLASWVLPAVPALVSADGQSF